MRTDGSDEEVRPVFIGGMSEVPDRLEERVGQFIRLQGLFAGAEGILLAVSGGADSTALLHVLNSFRAQGVVAGRLVCAHINHKLRGPAGDADEQFVIEQADRLGLPIVTQTVDVRAYAGAHELSIETAGRELRRASLSEIARDRGCTWVATGHQKNDNAETVIHRLGRGTGFRGLAGIWPVRRFGDLCFARPLLCATRREIIQYLERRNLHWREDHTNVDVAYTRNRIRHILLPLLQQEARDCLIEGLSELAASARKLLDRTEREAQEAWSRLAKSVEAKIVLEASGLAALPEPVAIELLRRAIGGERDLTRHHYRSILQLARENVSGKKVSLPGGLAARCEQEHITLSVGESRRVGLAPPESMDLEAGSTILHVPGKTRFGKYEIEARILTRDDVDEVKIEGDKSRFSEYFDLDQVKQPILVRLRRAGDRFQPLGMSDEKKVGKFLTTAKAPADLRRQILVFADAQKIIWVCPVRISERVKVTDRTQRILQVTVSGA